MTEPVSRAESNETLRLLYPIFKDEVFKRRAAMARIARRGALLFVSLSVIALLFSTGRFIHPRLKALVALGTLLGALLLIFQIREEKSRHEKAKRQLIVLEKGMGFFDHGVYIPNESLFPTGWKERPKYDRELWISIACLAGAALSLILTVLLV